jgi:mono/diheme cytochrome c family protein
VSLSSLPLAVRWFACLVVVAAVPAALLQAANQNFRGAPDSTKQMQNPLQDSPDAIQAGKPLYHLRCARCHGERGEGSGNIPPLRDAAIRAATPGEIFWFITKGDVKHEMPSWALEDRQLHKDARSAQSGRHEHGEQPSVQAEPAGA